MSCVYCAPKSRMRMDECMSSLLNGGSGRAGGRSGEMTARDPECGRLQDRADEKGGADPPVLGRKMAYRGKQRRTDQRRNDEHDAVDRVERAHGDALLARIDRIR